MALRNTMLSLGMLTVPVAVESAQVSTESLATLCNHGGDGDPTRINKLDWCVSCGDTPPAEHLVKGKDVGEGFALLTDEESERLKEAPKAFGKRIELRAHPAAEVEAATYPGGTSYFLAAKADTTPASYATLVALVEALPKLALVARFTLRTGESLFRLQVRGGALFLQQLVWPAQAKAAPAAVEVPVKRAQVTQAKGLIEQLVEPFQASEYVEAAAVVRAEILDGRQPAGTAAPTETAAAGPMNVMDALRASVTELKGSGRSERSSKLVPVKDRQEMAAVLDLKEGKPPKRRQAAS